MKRVIALLLSLLVAFPSWAAVAIHDVAAPYEQDGGTSITASFTTTTGATKLVACASLEDGTSTFSVTGATWNGDTVTAAVQKKNPGGSRYTSIWYIDTPDIGTADFVLTSDETISDWGLVILSLRGTATGVKDTDEFSSDSDTTATFSLTGIVATDFILTCAIDAIETHTWTHGAGQTELFDFDFGPATPSARISSSWELGEAAPSSTTSDPTAIAIVAAAFSEARRRAKPKVFP